MALRYFLRPLGTLTLPLALTATTALLGCGDGDEGNDDDDYTASSMGGTSLNPTTTGVSTSGDSATDPTTSTTSGATPSTGDEGSSGAAQPSTGEEPTTGGEVCILGDFCFIDPLDDCTSNSGGIGKQGCGGNNRLDMLQVWGTCPAPNLVITARVMAPFPNTTIDADEITLIFGNTSQTRILGRVPNTGEPFVWDIDGQPLGADDLVTVDDDLLEFDISAQTLAIIGDFDNLRLSTYAYLDGDYWEDLTDPYEIICP